MTNKLQMFKRIIFGVVLGVLFITKHEIHAQNLNQEAFTKITKIRLPENNAARFEAIAKTLLGKPYVAATLEANQEERLIVNLQQFDCTTLVESALAITLNRESDYKSFENKLTAIRYRNGRIDGYTSRIHYLTDWLLENEKNGFIKLESKAIGGVPFKKEINFMSEHPDRYPKANTDQLKNDVKKAEKNLNNSELYYIPKVNIPKIEHLLRDGDIIAITTSIPGLDCSHQGIAIIQNGKVYLLHASSKMKKVIVSQEPLMDYLNKNKSQNGIMVARIQ